MFAPAFDIRPVKVTNDVNEPTSKKTDVHSPPISNLVLLLNNPIK
jgi:hypothetical protein